jgi:hypothetical protein
MRRWVGCNNACVVTMIAALMPSGDKPRVSPTSEVLASQQQLLVCKGTEMLVSSLMCPIHHAQEATPVVALAVAQAARACARAYTTLSAVPQGVLTTCSK